MYKMISKNQFEKPLKLMKLCLLLSGIKVDKRQWHPVLETLINRALYYFNLIILYSVIFAEIFWLVDGIQIGRDFVEMSLTAPCITISILATLKTLPLYFKRNIVCHIIETLENIHPEKDYKKVHNSGRKNQQKNSDNKQIDNLEENPDKPTTDEDLATNSVKLLKSVEFLLSTISVAVLATFLLAPLVLIYLEYHNSGEMKIKYPFSVKYWFDAYEVKIWPLVYLQQVWATIIVSVNIFGTETLFYSLCTYMEMHFRILCHQLENIQARSSRTQEALVAGVRKHQLLIDLVEKTEEVFSQPVLFHFVSSSLLICLSAFDITVAKEIGSVFAFVSFLVLSLSQVSLLCYFGDKLMRSSTDVGGAIYRTSWYDFDVNEKKAVLIIIIRAQKPCKLTASKFADLNLRAFTTILSRSWSYFALLKTVYN